MAEITTPKPYRDFYVTSPSVAVQSQLEILHTHIRDLQKIVSTGYVAEEPFDYVGSQLVTFSDEKHGFSITNDYSKMDSWVMDFSDVSLWEHGSLAIIPSEDGFSNSVNNTPNNATIRTTEFFSIKASGIRINVNSNATNYQLFVCCFDSEHTCRGYSGWLQPNSQYTLPMWVRYIRVLIKTADNSDISLTNVFPATTLTLTLVPQTAPYLKVSEAVIPLPQGVQHWEQGSIYANGTVTDSALHIRTIDYIPVEGGKSYYLRGSVTNSVNYRARVYEYDKDGVAIPPTTTEYLYMNNEEPRTLNENTAKVKVVLDYDSTSEITPESVWKQINYIQCVGEEMIVAENDTRIVTMPPFKNLSIESNIPYHGHALDILESE